MPRKPKLNSGKSLTIHAKTLSDEEKIRAFKELHARNFDLELNSTIMEAINTFLKKHNWPPGNSQTVMEVFCNPKRADAQQCSICEETAIGKAKATNGWQGLLCQRHYEQSRDARLLRKWKPIC